MSIVLNDAISQPLVAGMKTAYGSAGVDTNGEDVSPSPPLTVVSTSSMGSSGAHKTGVGETFIHLLKGYMGAGCLSLPWAVSQLGLFWGTVAIFAMGYWSSYNCWTVVKLKRYIERSTPTDESDDKMSMSEASSAVSSNTNITYPDVGDWAHGSHFQSYIAACVCVQQLAICTVFISFVGENLLAVMDRLDIHFALATHAGVMTLALPFIMGLSFIPSLKSLAPVMAMGTIMLLISFICVGVIIGDEWEVRPTTTVQVNPPLVPLAVCAILYSYEGICLILPVESAMKEPQHFKKVFIAAMTSVAVILAVFAAICVITFGNVTSGSVTAFLLGAYEDDPTVTFWLMVANTAVSLSVLLTYPLQLFPALEILAPAMVNRLPWGEKPDLKDDQDDDFSAFEPLPPLPEHGYPSLDELPPNMEHNYDDYDESERNEDEAASDKDTDDNNSMSAMSSMVSLMPKMIMPGDSPLLRAMLVLMTYLVAVIVPNVQSLISLAGALAGSSTALLIPPILELAWIRHLETDLVPEESQEEEKLWLGGVFSNIRWSWEKVKCYLMLLLGLIFMLFGTYASLADIVRIYLGGEASR
jgi:amino acid permease